MSGRGQEKLATASCFALVTVAALCAVSGPTAAAVQGNEAPLADAGLDQNVSANATVHLDATGSRDPDGEIAAYEWQLERPDGNYTAPDCRTCGRTSFVARQVGTYNATVTVTDGDGVASTDTLRVHVSESDGPELALSGPEAVVAGDSAGFSVSVTAGSTELAAVSWQLDGRRVNRTPVGGDSALVDYSHQFSTAGSHTLEVTAVDRLGRERTASLTVTVRDPEPVSQVDESSDGSDGVDAILSRFRSDSDGESCSRFNRDDDTYCHNDRMTMDRNGITVSDADNDGTTEWAGKTLGEDFAKRHDGVSYDSTDGTIVFDSKQAYKEAMGVDEVNVDPGADLNWNVEKKDDNNIVNEGSNDNPFGVDFSDIAGGDGNTIGANNPFTGNGDDRGNDGEDKRNKDSGNNSGINTNTRTGHVPPSRGSSGLF